MTGKDITQIRKKRLILPGEKTVYDGSGKRHRFLFRGKRHRIFLKFKETMRDQPTEKDYINVLDTIDKDRFRRRAVRGKIYHTGHRLMDDENIQEDESATEWKSRGRKVYRGTRGFLKHNIRTLQMNNNDYARLKTMENQKQLLQHRKNQILNKANRSEYKEKIKSASSTYQKRQLKKEMASSIRKREGNWVRRTSTQFFVRKKKAEQRIRVVKRVLSTVVSSLSLLLVVFVLLGIGAIIFLSGASGAAEYAEKAITPNDYSTLSDSTAFLKQQETDLEEIFVNEEKRREFEEELKVDYGEDIYEFVYELPEFGFNSTTLMAYLSAKYGSFTLNQVQAELESVFGEMYTIEIEVREEIREGVEMDSHSGEEITVEELKKICYVKVSKKELEEVVSERMTDEEKEKYDTYTLSSGGQQVYGPVMVEDWTGLISSDYGERIHPVTGQRTFHNGVDVAIPTGTKLYSAVTGTVITAQYSETAGNYIRVQTDSGWVVTFMHMDTLAVTTGQTIKRGDFVGHSGNTGRSTGPHLHLEVRDASNNPINPVFIVPQNCYQEGENNT